VTDNRARRRPAPRALRPEDEFALRESRRRHRDSFDRLPFGILQHAADGRLLQANATLARLLGYPSAEELLGARRPALEEFARLADDRSETLLTHRNGSGIPVRTETREIRDSDGGILYRETRISGLRERPSNEDYARLFERVPLPMWVYDRETLAFLAANEAAVRAYGYTAEEFRGLTILDIRPREELADFRQALGLATGDEFHAVGRHRRKDGSIFSAEVFSRSLNFAGRPARLVVSCDVTERVHSEERLRKSSEGLGALPQWLPRIGEQAARSVADERRLGEIVAGELSGRRGEGQSGAPHERLSERESRVFRALARGRTMTSIARELSISVQTVSTYRSRIFAKMGLHSREDLVRYAARRGLID
jgi:PAS domain S-box-containing protein